MTCEVQSDAFVVKYNRTLLSVLSLNASHLEATSATLTLYSAELQRQTCLRKSPEAPAQMEEDVQGLHARKVKLSDLFLCDT